MIEEITNVTPENEQPLPENPAAEKKEKSEKKNSGKTARGVAMGAAMAGAAGAGAAVAHAMQPGEVDDVVEEVVEVSPETAEASPFAQVFNHDDSKPSAPVTPERDGDTQNLREPDLHEDTPVHDDTDPVTPEDGEDLPLTPEDEITADEPAELPEFIEQPDMSEIEVHIDENIDMDDPLGSMETV